MKLRDQDALDYHEFPRPGKIEVQATKPCVSQVDLSLAYSPGVAIPCLEIEKNPGDAYRYTNKGNLVAVVSNGTAVLGLGSIGALAGKPVMEGKGVLFKRFAQIDVFDIELDTKDPEEIIRAVEMLAPTFGGINLEDIKAPECFLIEKRLTESLDIPVFHDDQHGTAIISGAALLNACELTDRKMEDLRIVVAGAGAAGMACADFFCELGVDPARILMTDSQGVLFEGRTERMNAFKEKYARPTDCRSLEDALRGADVFCGVSVANTVSQEMILSMADRPIVFAMANPDPEIPYDQALAARSDIIMATGRSDFPNQVNNVLGFPFIFRGALDVHARAINMEMKVAAANALARLAKEPVPDSVQKAYGGKRISYGNEYIIPKPFDHRVLLWVAPAVAEAAIETGVARQEIDMDEYRDRLERLLGASRAMMRSVINRAKSDPKKILFAEPLEEKVLHAAQILDSGKIVKPVLVGCEEEIRKRLTELELDIPNVEILDPARSADHEDFTHRFYRQRRRRGVSPYMAKQLMRDPLHFGLMCIQAGQGDGLVCGINRPYPEALTPTLQVIPNREGVRKVAGLYMMILKKKVLFFADATVNIDPTPEELADIALMSADFARSYFDVDPRVAMLSFSNFGSVKHPRARKVEIATRIAQERRPDLVIDGEIQADTALVPDLASSAFPHSSIVGDANVLVFPDLESGNMAYKLVQHLAGAEVVGPILLGLDRPVNILNHYSSTGEIVNIAAITAVMASQNISRPSQPSVDRSTVEV